MCVPSDVRRQILPLNIRNFKHPHISKHQDYKIFFAFPHSKHHKTKRFNKYFWLICVLYKISTAVTNNETTSQQITSFPH